MEVIAIAGYITDEKMHIARDYLEKTAREACGVKPEQVFHFNACSTFSSFPSTYMTKHALAVAQSCKHTSIKIQSGE